MSLDDLRDASRIRRGTRIREGVAVECPYFDLLGHQGVGRDGAWCSASSSTCRKTSASCNPPAGATRPEPDLLVWLRRHPPRYGFFATNPFGNFVLASSSLTAGTMMTSSPCFQSAGVATE